MTEVAVSLAVSFAISALTYALTPKPEPLRSNNLNTLKSEYGVGIPRVYGTHKVTGNVFWAENIKEKESGGKGSPKSYKYSGTFAVMLAEGVVHRINKIWLNNRLVYFGSSTDANSVAASLDFYNDFCTFHYGTGNQPVDATIESVEGVGLTPAFTNQSYIVFKDLPLSKYANIIPVVQVEVESYTTLASTSNLKLSHILDDVCSRAGLLPNQFDTASLSNISVRGAIHSQDNETPRQFIESLQKAYHFIARDSGNKIEFIPIESSSVTNVFNYDLNTRNLGSELGDSYVEIKEKIEDLPSLVQLEYPNYDNNLKISVKSNYKANVKHTNETNERTNVVLTDSEALTNVTKSLAYYWNQNLRYESISLPFKYFSIKAGQLLNLNIRGQNKVLQVSKVRKGSNLVLEVDATSYSAGIGALNLVSTGQYNPKLLIPFAGQPTPIVVDTSLANDDHTDSGIYGSAKQDENASNWQLGSLVARPSNQVFTNRGLISTVCSLGKTQSALATSSQFVVDYTSKFIVELTQGMIDNITDDEFYNLEQLAYLNGELIAFKNAILVGIDTYEVSTLIRGVRGTENSIINHASGSDFILIQGTNSCIDATGNFNSVNVSHDFKAIPDGKTESSITGQVTLLTQGNRVKPYAPSNPRLKRKTNGDLVLSWERRSRRNGEWLDGNELLPLNQSTELYDIEFYNGQVLVLSVNDITVGEFTLSTSQQITLFGSQQPSLSFKLWQKSGIIGRGHVLAKVNFSITEADD